MLQRPSWWAAMTVGLAVLLVLPLPAGAGPSDRPPAPPIHLPTRAALEAPVVGSGAERTHAAAPVPSASNWTLSLSIPHLGIDLGGSFTIRAVFPGKPSNYTFNWTFASGLRLHPNGGNNATLFGTPTQPFLPPSGTPISLNATRIRDGSYHVVHATLFVNQSFTVQVGAFPTSGVAPLPVELLAYISGGSPPYMISWLTGDQNVGIGRYWNHTYSGAGQYVVEVWVNDSTSFFEPQLASVFAEINISVTAPHTPKGPFGLPSLVGWGIIAGLGVLIAAGLVYGVATRSRPKRLPPPEPWMRRGTEGRAGGPTTVRDSEPKPPSSG